MLILPAIDLRKSRCVRLFQGLADQETVYSSDPIAMAKQWKRLGATALHVVDLDGAFEQKPVHTDLIAEMKKEVGIMIEVGGGFRTLAQMEDSLSKGIDKIILGTIAVSDPELLKQAVKQFGKRLSVSIDAKKDYVAIAGWKEVSSLRFDDLARRLRSEGVSEMHYTDTQRDGTLTGPNTEALERFMEAAGVPVTVAGGISQTDDVRLLMPYAAKGLAGIVIGKALYDGKVELGDALEAARAC